MEWKVAFVPISFPLDESRQFTQFMPQVAFIEHHLKFGLEVDEPNKELQIKIPFYYVPCPGDERNGVDKPRFWTVWHWCAATSLEVEAENQNLKPWIFALAGIEFAAWRRGSEGLIRFSLFIVALYEWKEKVSSRVLDVLTLWQDQGLVSTPDFDGKPDMVIPYQRLLALIDGFEGSWTTWKDRANRLLRALSRPPVDAVLAQSLP